MSLSRKQFFILGHIDIWGQIILCCGSCPMYCRMSGIVLGLYPWDTSSTAPIVTMNKLLYFYIRKKCLQTLQISLENHWYRERVHWFYHIPKQVNSHCFDVQNKSPTHLPIGPQRQAHSSGLWNSPQNETHCCYSYVRQSHGAPITICSPENCNNIKIWVFSKDIWLRAPHCLWLQKA